MPNYVRQTRKPKAVRHEMTCQNFGHGDGRQCAYECLKQPKHQPTDWGAMERGHGSIHCK